MALNTAVTDTKWSPAFSAGRPVGAPDSITIHHWGSDGQTHQGVVDYLTRPGATTSAHYVVSDGRVTQIVHDYDRAWHAGDGITRPGNGRSIGIECRPEMSDGDFETVAKLIAAIRAQWGNLPLFPHSHWTATACPGRWRDRLGELSARADAIAGGSYPTQAPSPAPIPAPAPSGLAVDGWVGPATVSRWQQIMGTIVDGVISGQYSGSKKYHARLSSIQYQGNGQSQLVKAVQGAVGVAQDGFLGPDTINAIQGRLGVARDGYFGPDTATALQNRLNSGSF